MKIKKCKELEIELTNREGIIYDKRSKKVFYLNRCAKIIWENIEKAEEINVLVEILRKYYIIKNKKRVESDIKKILKFLENNKLITINKEK